MRQNGLFLTWRSHETAQDAALRLFNLAGSIFQPQLAQELHFQRNLRKKCRNRLFGAVGSPVSFQQVPGPGLQKDGFGTFFTDCAENAASGRVLA